MPRVTFRNRLETLGIDIAMQAGAWRKTGYAPAVVDAPPSSGQQVSNLVVLEDFSSWRTANNGVDKYFDVYNNHFGDAGPGQTVSGVSNNALVVNLSADDIFYVDADSAQYTEASHWMRSHIVSGTWNDAINRMTVAVRPSIAGTRDSSGGDDINIGTYIKPVDNFSPGAEGTDPQNGAHYYHGMGANYSANRWIKLLITNKPQHIRGGGSGENHNPITNYFKQMTRFYTQMWGHWDGNPASTFEMGKWQLFSMADEPDEYISSLTIQYTGTRYEVTWAARKQIDDTFDIRYRTDGTSMKGPGFTSGTNGGTASSPGSDYTGCFWASSNMSESTSGIYVAIRRQGDSLFHEIFLPYQYSTTNTGLVGV